MSVMSRPTRHVLLPLLGVGLAVSTTVGLTGPTAEAASPRESSRVLFDGGGDDTLNGIRYHSFRIPAIVTTKSGTLLAFAEGRHRNNKDFGNINLVFKRSTDNGKTWSKLDEVVGSGEGTWGNPTPVVDRDTGRIWMFMTHQPEGASPVKEWDDRQVYTSYSDDDGKSWSKPVDRTEALKPKKKPSGEAFTWDAMGPGIGIQTTVDHPGRLVIPAQHRNIYSDDHGKTWTSEFLSADGQPMEGTGETGIAELTDGRLYRSDRPTIPVWEKSKRRQVATGRIGGDWEPFHSAPCLLEPRNQGSVLRYNTDDPARLVFLNSASTETRHKMRVRVSEDDGRTWAWSRPLSDAPLSGLGASAKEGGYSSMTKTADYAVGALVEINENTHDSGTSHRSISFRSFNLPWMQGGKHEPGCAG